MNNKQNQDRNYAEDLIRATEHEPDLPEIDGEKVYKAVEKGVVNTYEKIENAVVSGYKKIENGAVSGFNKLTDKMVAKFFARDGETVEEAKERLKK